MFKLNVTWKTADRFVLNWQVNRGSTFLEAVIVALRVYRSVVMAACFPESHVNMWVEQSDRSSSHLSATVALSKALKPELVHKF